jgi:uncharacterized SAM-binding protein YcdF (DUF218 family)
MWSWNKLIDEMHRQFTEKDLSKIQKTILCTAVLVFLASMSVLIIKFDSIITNMGNLLIVNQEPQKADAIIILGGGSDRVAYGVKLYQSGYASKLLLSGGNANSNRNMKQQALSLGVPDASILQEDLSRTTFENAKYSLKIVQAQGYKSVIVVTSPYHTRRASIIFTQFFKGIDVIMCPVPYDPAITGNWWKDSYSSVFVISEYLKLIWHDIFERN